ncbi:inner membrane protein [Halomicrobium zhouii]|uniref:Inner membrane protein n=1 Tax=Halomicrobium zhouii TaxID=767519 RepID=A0A1I6LS42_9EURY|nr:metal-dependent hydrolase [Halomicrobium zhouii]SFS06256.1 inner membrane protein [Halomicrobium zhouii]
MKQLGHYGTALLLYSPVALFLLASGEDALALGGGALAITLAMAPDCDRPIPFVDHRGPTHTFGFAILVGLLVGAAGWVVGSQVDAAAAQTFGRFAFAVGALTVVSHLLADVITPMGIRPFWPLSDRHFTLDLVYAKNWAANVLLFVLGAVATLLVVFASRGA